MKRSLLSTHHWRAVGLFLVFLLAIGIVGAMDKEAEQMQDEHYCEMVTIWNADKASGIPAADRNGWPPFEGQCDE